MMVPITIPPHRFIYFTEPVPRRLSFGLTIGAIPMEWIVNQTLIPAIKFQSTTLTKVNGANRDAAWPAHAGWFPKQD